MKQTIIYTFSAMILMIGGAIAWADSSSINIELTDSLSKHIFVGSNNLNTTTLTFSANTDISTFRLESLCDIDSKLISRELNTYTFALRYNKSNCSNDAIYFMDTEDNTYFLDADIDVYTDYDLYNKYTDYSDHILQKISINLSQKIEKMSIFADVDTSGSSDKYDFYKKKIQYYQFKYNAAIIENILAYRQNKYIVPVAGEVLPSRESKLPNSLRPYRAEYTDGIHHAWDVDGEKGEETIALDNGIIIRVVDNFTRAEFSKINYGDNLSDDQKIKNLDILRGKQVWLKTMKGDVVFYSHLEDVAVQKGDIVFAGDVVGTIGSTGVPEVGYDDYHLHFPVHKNPYDIQKAGSWSNDDIMKWPWYFKGKSVNYIREHQSDIFK